MTTNSPNPVDGDVQALVEHIKAVIDEYESFGAGGMDEQVYRIALAALTVEPIEYLTWHQGCRAPDDCEIYAAVAEKSHKSDDGSDAIPVYTTPPAKLLRPVELPDEEAFHAFNNDVDCPLAGVSNKVAARKAWNAAIAEVQRLNATAQPVSDGWVKCDERVPDNEDYYLTYSNSGIDVAYFDGRIFSDRHTNHWMPLPAAPGGQD